MMISLGSLLVRRAAVLVTLPCAVLGLEFSRLQSLVLYQKVIDRRAQQHRARYSRVGRQLLEQIEFLVIEVQGFNRALCLTHG